MALDMEMKTAFEEGLAPIKAVQAEIKKAQDELKEKLVVLDEKKASAEDFTDISGRLKESQDQLEKLGQSYGEMQKKMAQRFDAGKDAARMIAEAKGLGDAIREGKGMEFKDITTSSFAAAATPAAPGVRVADRRMIVPVQQRLFLRDVIPTASTNAAVIPYLQEAGFTNSAAVVAEGGLKPQSELTFEEKNLVMKKLAHHFRISEEALDDVDALESYIRERGLWGLRFREEEQLISGNGSATQPDGLLMQSTAYVKTTVPGVTPAHAMDDIAVASAQVEAAHLFPSAVVMNAKDAWAMKLEKDADGRYLNPAFGEGTAWGLPVVSTYGIAQGKFIVGGFVGNALIWQRKGIEVRRSTEDRDNFVKNLVTILVEERLNLEVLRPEGIVAGTLTTTP
jgi:HK97 family phage major capsid protein